MHRQGETNVHATVSGIVIYDGTKGLRVEKSTITDGSDPNRVQRRFIAFENKEILFICKIIENLDKEWKIICNVVNSCYWRRISAGQILF